MFKALAREIKRKADKLVAFNERCRHAWDSPNMPHADYDILHAPGVCSRCDQWPTTQKHWQEEGRIFTPKLTEKF